MPSKYTSNAPLYHLGQADQPTQFTQAEINRWNDSRGSITQTIQGNQVDIWVRLASSGMTRLWWFLVISAAAGTIFIFLRILQSIVTGRAAEILSQAGTSVRF